MKAAARIIVKGLVQGVGYRYFCYRKAIEHSITGFARNLFTGEVELEAEGEKSSLLEFIKELRTGPAGANVKAVISEEIPFENKYSEFNIR